jgi:hypothetical protein
VKYKFAYSLIKILYLRHSHGDVAQLARVLDWQSRGRGFEPHLLHKKALETYVFKAFFIDFLEKLEVVNVKNTNSYRQICY